MKNLGAPLTSGSIVADVISRLENAIMAGELVSGDRISEHATAKQLNVSRGAVREALRQLEGRRLVERTMNVGVRVAAISASDLIEIFQVWGALGALAAKLATPLATSKEIKELRELASSYLTEGYNRQRNFDIHTVFHARIVAITKNSYLINTCDAIFDILRLERFKLSSAPRFFERTKEVIQEQVAVVDAMSKRDAASAEQAMEKHFANSLKYHVEMVRPEAGLAAQRGLADIGERKEP